MSSQKGLELPINMIVVIAIAVLVLVVVAAFFAGRIGGGGKEILLNQAFNNGCNTLRFAYQCDANSITDPEFRVRGYPETAPGQTPVETQFFEICAEKGYSTPIQCARVCGCTGA